MCLRRPVGVWILLTLPMTESCGELLCDTAPSSSIEDGEFCYELSD
jgi:hypothetical protein